MTNPNKMPPRQPQPNVFGTLRGTSTSPWVTLRSVSEPLIANIGNLRSLLLSIDSGLEIEEADDGLGLRVQPKAGATRTRSELYAATRQLTRTQNGWIVKWEAE